MKNKYMHLFFTGLTMIIIGFISTTSNAYALDLGGVDMQAACSNQHPGTTVELAGNNVYSWRCYTYSAGRKFTWGIDVRKQCKAQHGYVAEAAFYDENNPYSWYCYI